MLFRRHSIQCLALIGCLIAAGMFDRPARAHSVQLIDTDTSVAANRVILTVVDPEDGKTRTWKSETYAAVSSLESDSGFVTWIDEDAGWVRAHVAAYDPGDRKWHTWHSRNSDMISELTASGGVVSYFDEFWGGVVAIAYDPAERAWKKWDSPIFTDVTSLTNTNGVVAFLAGNNRFMYAAAYDLTGHKWRQTIQGPVNSLASLTNESGVVSLLVERHVVALAFDPVDHKWHPWVNLPGIDAGAVQSGTVVAFSRGTTVHAIAYDADDHKWHTWSNNPGKTISNLDVQDGFVYYTYNNVEYSHEMARTPKASFIATRTSRSDSMYIGFTDNSFGDITGWRWDFGDTRSSSEQSPYRVYSKIGNFSVKLTVTGPTGIDSTTRNVSVTTPTYTLSYAAGSNGTLLGAKSQSVKRGASGTTITAVAATGYHFVQWSDGSMANPRIDRGVTESFSVTASFARNVYTVTFETDGTAGSMLSGVVLQQLSHGASATSVRAIPPARWRFVKWISNGEPYSAANPLTIKNVTADMSLVADFSNTSAAGDWAAYE